MAVSFDGRYALTGDAERAIRLWDLEQGVDLRLFDAGGSAVEGVVFAPDLRFALSAGADGFVRHWTLDLELEEQTVQAWDDRALPYLDRFLTLHTPPMGELPEGRAPFEKEIFRTIAREGAAVYSEDDVDELMATFGDAGFGWLTRVGVVAKLNERVKGWSGPLMPVTVFDTPQTEEDDSEAETVVGIDNVEVGHPRSGGLTGWMRSLTSKK